MWADLARGVALSKAGLFSRGSYSLPAEALQPAALLAVREVSPLFLKGDLGGTSWLPTQEWWESTDKRQLKMPKGKSYLLQFSLWPWETDTWRLWELQCLGLNPEFTTSLGAQLAKNLPAIQETRVQSLGQRDPLEKEMATHSSILAWRIPWTEEPRGLWSIGSPVRLDWMTNTFTFHFHHFQPTKN